MGKTLVADIIVPSIFEKYAIERTADCPLSGSAVLCNRIPSSMPSPLAAGKRQICLFGRIFRRHGKSSLTRVPCRSTKSPARRTSPAFRMMRKPQGSRS